MSITAAITDHCRECGCSIYSAQGCPSDFLCDDCCRAAGHQHPWLKPQPRKEATMRSYINQFVSGLFGRFRRGADGSLECLDLALDTDAAAMTRIVNAVRREAEVVRAASTPTVDKLVSSGYDAARAHYRDAIDRGDSEAASRATEAIGRLRREGRAETVAEPPATRSAAAPSPGMLKQIVLDSFAGGGEKPKEESPLLRDPDYVEARNAGDTEAMARIAHEFGRRKP